MRLFWLSLLILIKSSLANAIEMYHQEEASVFSKFGNIFYKKSPSHIIQVTYNRKDFTPVLSPNKKIIAFIRVGTKVVPEKCDGDTQTKYGNQIWIYDISSKKERLLVDNNFQCDIPQKQIVDPTALRFSPDSKVLYFMVTAWTTSSALHQVRIDKANECYIAPANSFQVVSKGRNKGYLIVEQHRYFVGGGSYDWYWLLNSKGKEEGTLGPEITKEQMNYLES